MANQIGKFFAHQGEAKAVPAIAGHLARFWDRRICAAVLAHLAAGAGRDPFVLAAVRNLQRVG